MFHRIEIRSVAEVTLAFVLTLNKFCVVGLHSIHRNYTLVGKNDNFIAYHSPFHPNPQK